MYISVCIRDKIYEKVYMAEINLKDKETVCLVDDFMFFSEVRH